MLQGWPINAINDWNDRLMAGFRPNSEIIGKIRKMGKFYGHFVKRKK